MIGHSYESEEIGLMAEALETAQHLVRARAEVKRLRAALRDIEMETRDGGQWTLAEVNELAKTVLKE